MFYTYQLDQYYNSEMHSASARFNNVTLFTALTLGFFCLVNFFHGYSIYNPTVETQLSINSITNFAKTPYWDQVSFKYSLHSNLSTLYTWNLKQLFVYVEFEWVDKVSNLSSRTIASDWILEIPQKKEDLYKDWVIDVKDGRFEYLIRDVHNGLRGNTLTVSLNVQYMPIVGGFFKSRLHSIQYKMPETYSIDTPR